MQRRQMMRRMLGLGGLGMASMATGLPTAFLRQPTAWAGDTLDPATAQYLIFSGRDSGDPFNANVPGTYKTGIVHADDPAMAKTDIMLGDVATTAAKLWSTLPQWVLDRTSFIHHATKTQVHGHLVKVLQLLGDSAKAESIPAFFAKQLAPVLGTIATPPVPVGQVNMTFAGRTLPQLKPTTLRELLVADDSPLGTLQAERDVALDRINEVLRDHGSTAQRKFLFDHAMARADVREMADGAASLLADVDDDSPSSQIRAAVALIKLNLTPVVAIALPFGSDNHNDKDLAREVDEHTSGIGYIAELMALLEAEGLQDRVTFASINVFGRTLANQGFKGRTHHSKHHVTMLTGSLVLPGVVGGLEKVGDDFEAMAFDSTTGMPSGSGDVSYEDGLPSMGKTLGAVLGIPSDALDTQILRGKVITAAVAS